MIGNKTNKTITKEQLLIKLYSYKTHYRTAITYCSKFRL